jgi:hypothetical protein
MDFEGELAYLLVSVKASDNALFPHLSDLLDRSSSASQAVVNCATDDVDWSPNMWTQHRGSYRTILEVDDDE